MDGPISIGRARRCGLRSMSTHTLLAMRYSHDRSDERPSKLSMARQARIIVSCTASSASEPEPEHAVAEAGELAAVGLERPVEVGAR